MTRPGFTHGTRYGYEQKKCKCPLCMRWSRLYKRRVRANAKARREGKTNSE